MKNWLGQDKSLSDIQREIYNKEAEIARKEQKIIAKEAKAKTLYVPKKSVKKLKDEKGALEKALHERKNLLKSQTEVRKLAAATNELRQHEAFKTQEEAKKEQNYSNAKKFFFNAIRVYSDKPYDLNAIIGKFAEKENEKSNKIDFVTNVKAAISAIGLAVQTPQTTSQLLWWAGYFLKESQNLAKNETRDESFFIKLLSDEGSQEAFMEIEKLGELLTVITPTAISAIFRALGQAKGNTATTLNALNKAGITSKVVSEALTPLIASAVPALLGHVGDISAIYEAVRPKAQVNGDAAPEGNVAPEGDVAPDPTAVIIAQASKIASILQDAAVKGVLTEKIPTLLKDNQVHIATALWTVAKSSGMQAQLAGYGIDEALLEQAVNVAAEIAPDLMPLVHTLATEALAQPEKLAALVESAKTLVGKQTQDNIAKFIGSVEAIPAIKTALTTKLPNILNDHSTTLAPLLKQYLAETEVGKRFYINTEKALSIASRKSSNIVELAKHYGNKNWVGVITEGAKILADKEGLSFVLAIIFKKPDLSHQKVTEGIRSNIESNNKGDVRRIPKTWVERVKKVISPGGKITLRR